MDGVVLTWPALFAALSVITTVIAAVWRVMDASVRSQTKVLNETVVNMSRQLVESHDHIDRVQAEGDERIKRVQAENEERLRRLREEYEQREDRFNSEYKELKALLQESERKHKEEMRNAQVEIDDLRKRVDALTLSYNTERDLRMRAEAEVKLLHERIVGRS